MRTLEVQAQNRLLNRSSSPLQDVFIEFRSTVLFISPALSRSLRHLNAGSVFHHPPVVIPSQNLSHLTVLICIIPSTIYRGVCMDEYTK